MTTGIRSIGDFCWINMLTPEPAQAMGFYATLLGWTYGDIPGMGHLIKVGGKDVGGIFDLNGPQVPPGTHPGIGVMVKVSSADATVAKIRANGGSARDPFDIATNLRMADCTDINGANIDLFEPRNGHGTEVDSQAHGAPCWFENLAADLDRAVDFYSAVFGWTSRRLEMADGSYTTLRNGEIDVAGVFQITPEMGNFPSHWAVYFTVSEIEESVQLAQQLGGTVAMPIKEIPEVGRIAALISPQGVMFYVITPSG